MYHDPSGTLAIAALREVMINTPHDANSIARLPLPFFHHFRLDVARLLHVVLSPSGLLARVLVTPGIDNFIIDCNDKGWGFHPEGILGSRPHIVAWGDKPLLHTPDDLGPVWLRLPLGALGRPFALLVKRASFDALHLHPHGRKTTLHEMRGF